MTGTAPSAATAELFGWLSRNHPGEAEDALTAFAEHAELRFGVPRAEAGRLLRAEQQHAGVTPLRGAAHPGHG
ncbi:hypothetical protein [Streptomyces sp. CAU 1734]|uniref:hypothetical protein n=1 Tax=Streptomyces sp. CAU 1734 TaxID=3140360 RepID=UPI003260929B